MTGRAVGGVGGGQLSVWGVMGVACWKRAGGGGQGSGASAWVGGWGAGAGGLGASQDGGLCRCWGPRRGVLPPHEPRWVFMGPACTM
jgi:hypothetical protein